MYNLGDIITVLCDIDGQPVAIPENYSYHFKRKFKLIGKGSPFGTEVFLVELHYSSPFGIKLSLVDYNNFEIIETISKNDYTLIKCFPIVKSAIVMDQKKSEGLNCKKCNDYYPYAEPNQQDGSLICYSCRI